MPLPAEQAIIATHFAYLKHHLAEGRDHLRRPLRRWHSASPSTTPQHQEAEAIMHNDPAIQANLMTATLYPFRVALTRTQEPVAAT
ncbi:MAG: hypothetical protein U0841_10690 [Chloroflexia bacterium]